MVGLTRSKLNVQLAEQLNEGAQKYNHQPTPEHGVRHYQARQWRVRDWLSEQDIWDIVADFKSGTAKHMLAARYGINLRSLKKLLREEGVKQRSRRDPR